MTVASAALIDEAMMPMSTGSFVITVPSPLRLSMRLQAPEPCINGRLRSTRDRLAVQSY